MSIIPGIQPQDRGWKAQDTVAMKALQTIYRAPSRHPKCCQTVQVAQSCTRDTLPHAMQNGMLAMPARSRMEGNQTRTASPWLSVMPHCNPSKKSPMTCTAHWTNSQDAHAQSAGSMTVPVCHCAQGDASSCWPVVCSRCKLDVLQMHLICCASSHRLHATKQSMACQMLACPAGNCALVYLWLLPHALGS